MRLLVCGGRAYPDYMRVVHELDHVNEESGGIEYLAQGEAAGADALAGCWALCRGVHIKGFPAEWQRYGRSAGPRRNALMLEKARPDLVLAFPGHDGTADMVAKARAAGVLVKVIR